MWNEIFSAAITNGIFAALFVGLLVYELKDFKKREIKCQRTIESLSNKLNVIDEIRENFIKINEQIGNIPTKRHKKQ